MGLKWQQQVLPVTGLSARAKSVLLMLAFHKNDMTGDCFPSRELLARELSCSVRSIANGLKELRERGFVKITRTKSSSRYDLHITQANFAYLDGQYLPINKNLNKKENKKYSTAFAVDCVSPRLY